MIYIIDTSGSMDGVSIKQARESLLFALDQLEPKDRFNLIAFNSVTAMLFEQAVPASHDNIQLARRAVSRLKSGGGTEMLPALQKALADSAPEGFVRQLVFITDGAVGNETALFETIDKQLGSSRLFTVGIGSAPNSYFMRKAAEFGRGTFTHIGQVSDVQQKMTALFEKLNSPVVTDISVSWPGGQHVESYPSRIPDLYIGEPLLLSIKTPDLRGEIVIKGKTAGNDWKQSIRVDQVQDHSGVATLWAREKIESLLDEKMTGRDPAEVRLDVLDVALTHQLVSPYTSFVAVEQVVSRPQLQGLASKPVLNAQPKGQGAQSYAYPQTATHALQSFLWGLLLLLMAVVLKRCMNKEVEYGLVD
jgi:Ca-activated chloride channel family protein